VKANKTGIIFDIERYAIHDGPGIRTVVFMKGCPLRCLWCDNPESQRCEPQLLFFKDRCTKCKRCLKICPTGANFIADNGEIKIDRKKCINCGKCIDVCLAEARKISGKKITAEEVLEIVKKDIPFYTNSGGGVTISGGESTYQTEFLLELLKKCKEQKLHVALETCGYVASGFMEKILSEKLVDLFLYDIKIMDPIKSVRLTGASNELILQNARLIANSTIPMVIRVPIIPSFTDSEENVRAISKFVATLKKVKKIELLPYHELGVPKYKWLDLDYKLKLQPPEEERINIVKKIVRSYKLECTSLGF